MSLQPLKSEPLSSVSQTGVAQKDGLIHKWKSPHIAEDQGDYKSDSKPSAIERLDFLKAEAWNTSAKMQIKKLHQLTELMQQSGHGPLSADIFRLYATEIATVSEALNMCIDGLWSHIDDSKG